MNTGVFDRGYTRGKQLSASMYNAAIGLVLLWGFAINWWMVTNISPEAVLSIHPLLFFGGYFVSCIGGVMLFTNSETPLISFIGYNMVVVPFGLVLNVFVADFDPMLIAEAVRVTASVTLLMMILGTLFPRFFQGIAGALTIALLMVIVVEMIEAIFFGRHRGIMDWIVVVIFCGYIGVDWGRANRIPKTLDNAIDSAAALYMDIINLFIRILSILGRRK
ncbi:MULTISPECIES: Bax inhibitor-1 family protein [Aliagarivorans]|uniref:Bax inhibitor-1 family protein n=1 Tax=Aliagarivorans TaxID=882379 RepID=UPI00040B6946|nr:Bax inhibitor-1 family protein [Aliagarivorans taiwanensis]